MKPRVSGAIILFITVQVVFTCLHSYAVNCSDLFRRNSGEVLITDAVPGFYGRGTVTNINGRNFLTLSIVTKKANSEERPSVLRGKMIIPQIVAEFENRNILIDAVKSDWNDRLREFGNRPSDNYIQFLKAYEKALSVRGLFTLPHDVDSGLRGVIRISALEALAEAARNTWSGQQMKELGFNGIEAIIINNSIGEMGFDGKTDGSIQISVVWVRTPVATENIKLIDTQTISHGRPFDGSSLPRLHQIISTLGP